MIDPLFSNNAFILRIFDIFADINILNANRIGKTEKCNSKIFNNKIWETGTTKYFCLERKKSVGFVKFVNKLDQFDMIMDDQILN